MLPSFVRDRDGCIVYVTVNMADAVLVTFVTYTATLHHGVCALNASMYAVT